MEVHVMQPLCAMIETDLRLHVHAAILRRDRVISVDPLTDGVRNMPRFLQVTNN
jgi:deoxycytidylate deaminase